VLQSRIMLMWIRIRRRGRKLCASGSGPFAKAYLVQNSKKYIQYFEAAPPPANKMMGFLAAPAPQHCITAVHHDRLAKSTGMVSLLFLKKVEFYNMMVQYTNTYCILFI
jgi:hypothetical protein